MVYIEAYFGCCIGFCSVWAHVCQSLCSLISCFYSYCGIFGNVHHKIEKTNTRLAPQMQPVILMWTFLCFKSCSSMCFSTNDLQPSSADTTETSSHSSIIRPAARKSKHRLSICECLSLVLTIPPSLIDTTLSLFREQDA